MHTLINIPRPNFWTFHVSNCIHVLFTVSCLLPCTCTSDMLTGHQHDMHTHKICILYNVQHLSINNVNARKTHISYYICKLSTQFSGNYQPALTG